MKDIISALFWNLLLLFLRYLTPFKAMERYLILKCLTYFRKFTLGRKLLELHFLFFVFFFFWFISSFSFLLGCVEVILLFQVRSFPNKTKLWAYLINQRTTSHFPFLSPDGFQGSRRGGFAKFQTQVCLAPKSDMRQFTLFHSIITLAPVLSIKRHEITTSQIKIKLSELSPDGISGPNPKGQ